MTGPKISVAAAALSIVLATLAAPAQAQEDSPGYLDRLATCRAIEDSEARLACYDREVGAVVAASEQGEVRLVDREEVRQTKRKLFGFAIPKGLFGGDDNDEMDLLETTITRVAPYGRGGYTITTEEGSVWQISNPPMRFAPPKSGQSVVFKRAALGSFFIRINGQLGVKGIRVE
ncbi:hypothetical protein I5L01_11185 [Erythrobacter sp. YJ-T3-07]|uniref:hypothetical protein n=1 Tax=Erythrobacter sp. YJ-T3-07 TaxID=2793063 RepID=UPI0018D36332|nr:hypothetical protein [Erythrobacter sp. YJ-T3-07]MBH1944796.1 hypothetical protein [Erythrobacter sp. YJ-T3-07]